MHEDKTDFDLAVGNRFINRAGETVEIVNKSGGNITLEVIKTEYLDRFASRYALSEKDLSNPDLETKFHLSHMIRKMR